MNTNEQRNPVVFEKGGEIYVNSREVAEAFEKRHDNVLRDIDTIIGSSELSSLMDQEVKPFVQVTLFDERANRDIRSFNMTRDGFTLLVVGWTGSKAMAFKVRYIQAFNAMEKELRSRASDPMVALNDPATMRQLLLGYSEKVMTLETRIAEQAPKVAALDRIAGSDGRLCITDAAKTLQVPPKRLFQWLQQSRWIYRRVGGRGFVAYQEKIQAGFLEHKLTPIRTEDGVDKVSEQVLVTPKGLARLSHILSRPSMAA